MAIKRSDPAAFVGIALLPCVYSSGTEEEVASRFSSVDAVSAPRATLRWILRGEVPPGFNGTAPGCALHLGGEPLLTLALARRTGGLAAAYLEGPLSWMGQFDRLFSRDAGVAARIRRPSANVGDLMVDAARLRAPNRQPPRPGEPPVIGVFPGSRHAFIKHMLPFFLRVAGLAHPRLPGARWVIARAEFISNADLAAAAADPTGRAIEGDSATYHEEAAPALRTTGAPPAALSCDPLATAYRPAPSACRTPSAEPQAPALITERGLRVEILDTGSVMSMATVALTLPGTNTAELSALGIPMVACTPSYKLDEVPLPGTLGYLDRIPLIGRAVKHSVVYIYGRGLRYLAHPNRRTRRRVVPEAIGRIKAERVADMLVALATAKDDRVQQELLDIMGPPGAADALAREILASLRTTSAT
jgi:lipid-A-disaccharide synthase